MDHSHHPRVPRTVVETYMYETHRSYTDVMALVMKVQTCIYLEIQKVCLRRCLPLCALSVNNQVTKGAPEVFVPEGGR